MTEPALAVDDLWVSYGRGAALFGVSLAVAPGETLAVLGPNGAGKTTLARALSGIVPVRDGDIRLFGESVTGWSTDRRARAGLVHVPDTRSIFPSLDVVDNLRMSFRHALPRGQRAAAVERALEHFPKLTARRRTPARLLSGGEQQMLSLARAIVAPPRILVLDELSHGLAPVAVRELFDGLAGLSGKVTMVLIEQFADEALRLADHAIVLSRGRVIHAGPASDVDAARLHELYHARAAVVDAHG